MICIAQNYLSLNVFLEIPMIDSLHRADRSDRHENRGLYLPVVRHNHSATGSGLGILRCLDKFHSKIFVVTNSKVSKITAKTLHLRSSVKINITQYEK